MREQWRGQQGIDPAFVASAVPAVPPFRYAARNESPIDVLSTASQKAVPRFLPDDVLKVSHRYQSRSWQRRGDGGGHGRRPVCRESPSSLAAHGSFGRRSQDATTTATLASFRDFFPELLHPTAWIATVRHFGFCGVVRRHVGTTFNPGGEWDAKCTGRRLVSGSVASRFPGFVSEEPREPRRRGEGGCRGTLVIVLSDRFVLPGIKLTDKPLPSLLPSS